MTQLYNNRRLTTEQSPSDDPMYLRYALPTPGADFYSRLNQDVTPMLGYETRSPHYGHALRHLNHHLAMRLDKLDLAVFELLLTSLAQANRFGGDLHICPFLGENSAIHTLRTLLLDTEVARRAGNLSDESQQDIAVCRQRIRRLRAILVHDIGEIPGEMTSLASRTRNSALQELPEIEREVFRIHLTEAYLTANSEPPEYPQFYSFQGFVRRTVAAARVEDERSQLQMATQLKEIVAQYDARHPQLTLPPDIRGRIQDWMYDFDTIELKADACSRERLFIGHAAKIAEHIQGTRHMIRFGTHHPQDTRLNLAFCSTHSSAPQDPLSQSDPGAMIPLRFLSNMRFIKSCRYMETELQGLFGNASSEHEFRHARALRDLLYLTQAEWISVSRPILNRRMLALSPDKQREESFISELQERIRRCSDHVSRATLLQTAGLYLQHKLMDDLSEARLYRKSLGATTPQDRLLDFETRGRMQALYLYAIQQDYIPETTTPLLLLEALPASLHGFTSRARQDTSQRGSPLLSLRLPGMPFQ